MNQHDKDNLAKILFDLKEFPTVDEVIRILFNLREEYELPKSHKEAIDNLLSCLGCDV